MLRYILFAIIMMSVFGCSGDIGLSHTIEERIEIIGDVAVETRYVHNQALDILMVVDTSCSMDEDIENMLNYIPTIHQELLGPDFDDLDWRFGVTTMSPNQQEMEKWVSWDDPMVEFRLQAMLVDSMSTEGYGIEQGLDSTINSLAWDTEFHRVESDTLIIFMSDEKDQSSISVEDYLTLTSNYKQHPFVVTESAIVPTRLNYRCDYANELGTGYLEVSEISVDLCDTNKWSSVLDYAKEHVPTLNRVWPLQYDPLEISSIEVRVNDQLWEDWEYDADRNEVLMTVIPESGALVIITYLIS